MTIGNSARWAVCYACLALGAPSQSQDEYYDAHVHLTNYIQEGITARKYLEVVGDRVGRSVLFGIPLQMHWSHRVTGDVAPTYYLDADTALYYYSFTDAYIAQQYLGLSPQQQARFEPMITGFNPADMYAADHIRRVLQTYPGVFSGIGEFTIHKEFVSAKVAGDVASLIDPAVDRIFRFCAESGLVAIMHNDIHMPFVKPEARRFYFKQAKSLLARHPDTTGSRATTCLFRYFLGRGGEICRRHAAGHEIDRFAVGKISRPISDGVRQRGTNRSPGELRGLRAVPASME
jgi:hypothetical protein